MKHSLFPSLLLGILVLCATPLFAANAASVALAKDPVTGLTANQAMKLGAISFINLYEEKTTSKIPADGHTEDNERDACKTFAQLRRYINDRAVVKRTKAQQTLIGQLRACCSNIAMSYVQNEEANTRGGASSRIEYAAGMIDVEITIGKVILAMEQPKRNIHGKQAAEKTLHILLEDLKQLQFRSPRDKEKAKTWREQHDAAVIRLKAELLRLSHLQKLVPDYGSIALARFADDASNVGIKYESYP